MGEERNAVLELTERVDATERCPGADVEVGLGATTSPELDPAGEGDLFSFCKATGASSLSQGQ